MGGGAPPYSPVGQLVLLVCLDSTAILEEKCEGELGEPEDPTGLTGIKQVYHIQPKVPL